MERLDIRDMIAENEDLSEETIDEAVRYIKDSEELMEMLDEIIASAIEAIT